MAPEQGNQLELFELTRQSAPRPHRETLGRFLLQFRYDQLLLAVMAGIVGLTVVFATGVERGKQLARAERAMLARQQPVPPDRPTPTPAVSTVGRRGRSLPQASAGVPAPVVSPPVLAAPAGPATTTASPSPAQKKEPVKAKAGKSRYAVQVVTFSRPQLAKQAMDRLRAKGERAFLVIRDGGRTVVYIGPFPSKDHAVEKVSALKTQFHDCFVKTL